MPLTISANSHYADQVLTPRPKEIATSYRLARVGADRFSVSAGMVFTRASSATFAAVDLDPTTNTTETAETVVGPTGNTTKTVVTRPELKSIIEKDRDTRSGTVALMANFRWGGGFSAGLRGGVGLATKEPALLAGLSFGFWKTVEIGIGCGWYQVRTLGVGAGGAQTRSSGDRSWATTTS
jgi:hypothetical protein